MNSECLNRRSSYSARALGKTPTTPCAPRLAVRKIVESGTGRTVSVKVLAGFVYGSVCHCASSFWRASVTIYVAECQDGNYTTEGAYEYLSNS